MDYKLQIMSLPWDMFGNQLDQFNNWCRHYYTLPVIKVSYIVQNFADLLFASIQCSIKLIL